MDKDFKNGLEMLLNESEFDEVIIGLQKRTRTSGLLLRYDVKKEASNSQSFMNILFTFLVLNSWEFLSCYPASNASLKIPVEDALLFAEQAYRTEDFAGIRSHLLSIKKSYDELLAHSNQLEDVKTNPFFYPLQLVGHLWSFRKSEIPSDRVRKDFCLHIVEGASTSWGRPFCCSIRTSILPFFA